LKILTKKSEIFREFIVDIDRADFTDRKHISLVTFGIKKITSVTVKDYEDGKLLLIAFGKRKQRKTNYYVLSDEFPKDTVYVIKGRLF
jgi:hypothetical protein